MGCVAKMCIVQFISIFDSFYSLSSLCFCCKFFFFNTCRLCCGLSDSCSLGSLVIYKIVLITQKIIPTSGAITTCTEFSLGSITKKSLVNSNSNTITKRSREEFSIWIIIISRNAITCLEILFLIILLLLRVLLFCYLRCQIFHF